MITRRSFAATVAGGFFGFAWRHSHSQLFAATASNQLKRCLVLWMEGGPSQLETFDPKPGTSTGGPTEKIGTSVPDIQIAASLPHVAQRMQDLAVVRNLTFTEGEHERATYTMHTGYPQVPGFPRPSIGSVISHAAPTVNFPQNVSIGGPNFGPAFLGVEHAPFSIGSPDESLAKLRRLKRKRGRLDYIQELNATFDASHLDSAIRQRTNTIRQLQNLVTTPFVDALDLARESSDVINRYGDGDFARNCLAARRLLEAGVQFVEVRQNGWDTHVNNFSATERLCQSIDQPWLALLQDLRASGLLAETLVVWMGEFGRTPSVNGNNGRDHFPKVTPVVLAGAGIQGGQVVGATNSSGTSIQGESYRVADLFATIYKSLGIDPDTEFETAFGAPTKITDDGEVITELFG